MTSRTLRYSVMGLVLVAAVAGGAYTFTSSAEAETVKNVAPAAGAPAASGKTLKQAIDPKAVYAIYDGNNITGKDVLDFIAKMPPSLANAPDQLLGLIVNQMVNDRLVAKAAAEEKLAEEDATKKRIKEAEEQVLRDRFVEKSLEGKVTEAKMKAKYDELVTNKPAPQEIHAFHILVKDEATAKDIIAKLAKGEKFADLAKKYSIDPSKDNGGDLGYVTKDQMVKEFGDALFAMKKGDVSKAPVKTQFGFHVIKAEDVRMKAKPKFEDVKEALQKQMTEEEIRNVVKALREKSKVEIKVPNA